MKNAHLHETDVEFLGRVTSSQVPTHVDVVVFDDPRYHVSGRYALWVVWGGGSGSVVGSDGFIISLSFLLILLLKTK